LLLRFTELMRADGTFDAHGFVETNDLA